MSRRRILKFTLDPSFSVTIVETADEPTWLSVGVQGTDIVVWCEAIVGEGVATLVGSVLTGQSPPDDAVYIGTAQLPGPIVVHVYRPGP